MPSDDAPAPDEERDGAEPSAGPATATTTAPAATPPPSEELDGSEERRRIVVVAGVAVVIIALLAFVLTRDGGSDDEAEGTASTEAPSAVEGAPDEGAEATVSITGTNDTFEYPDSGNAMPSLSGGALWEEVNGDWAIRDGAVALVAPSATRNFLVVDVGYPDQQSQVRLAEAVSGAGLTFRYQDEFHFWALEATDASQTGGALNVIKVDTEAQGPPDSFGVFRSIPDAGVVDGSTVGVILTGDQVQVVVDGRIVDTFEDPYLAGTGRVGFTARGTDESPTVSEARWDDFTAGGPTGEGVIGAERETPLEGEEDAPAEPGSGPTDTTAGG